MIANINNYLAINSIFEKLKDSITLLTLFKAGCLVVSCFF